MGHVTANARANSSFSLRLIPGISPCINSAPSCQRNRARAAMSLLASFCNRSTPRVAPTARESASIIFSHVRFPESLLSPRQAFAYAEMYYSRTNHWNIYGNKTTAARARAERNKIGNSTRQGFRCRFERPIQRISGPRKLRLYPGIVGLDGSSASFKRNFWVNTSLDCGRRDATRDSSNVVDGKLGMGCLGFRCNPRNHRF